MDKELTAYLDQRFDGIDQRFDGIDQRFDGIDQRFDGVEQRFERLEQLIDEKTGANRILIEDLRGQIQTVAEGVKSAENTAIRLHGQTLREINDMRIAARVAHSQVDARVSVLESRYQKLDQRLTSVEAEMIHGRQGETPSPPG